MLKYSIGFTIVELLIVIAIIGILSVIAIPSYKHYTTRARFTEVMLAAAPYKTAVALGLQEGLSKTDLNISENGIPKAPSASKNLASLKVKEGVITATASKLAGGYTYILTPDENGSIWSVSGTCLDAGLCRK